MTIKEKILDKIIPNLQKNQMQAFYVDSREEVVPLLRGLVAPGAVVANGGSQTLKQCGVIDFLKSGDFQYLDRAKPGLTPEQVRQVYLQSFGADAYFCSANAITEDGVLYNVDGNSNRIAAIAYGPTSVIMVVGQNKIVPDLDAAVQRVKTHCAPENCLRLACETYCRENGVCVSLKKNHPEIPSGCSSAARVCCNYLISAQQRHKDRIKVILVGEELGY